MVAVVDGAYANAVDAIRIGLAFHRPSWEVRSALYFAVPMKEDVAQLQIHPVQTFFIALPGRRSGVVLRWSLSCAIEART